MKTSFCPRTMVKWIGILMLAACVIIPQHTTFAEGPAEASDYNAESAVPYRVGMFHVERKEYAQAVTFFTEAIRLEPDFDEAFLARAECYVSMKQYPQALSDFAQVIVLMPEYGQPYFERGLVYTTLKQFEAAITDLQTAIKFMPIVPDPLLALANLYYDRGEAKQSLPYYERYLKLANTAAEPYVVTRVKQLKEA